MSTCKTIAIFNHKGGVGKTTTAVNLAAGLVHCHGERCLVVDMDPQANATRALLGRDLCPERRSMKHVLLDEGERSLSIGEVLVSTAIPGLTVAPAALSLSEAEFKLVSRMSREHVLRDGFARASAWADGVDNVHLGSHCDAWLQKMLEAAGLLIHLSDSCALVENPAGREDLD